MRPTDEQVVALLGVEQAIEEAFHGVSGGRLARTHRAVNQTLAAHWSAVSSMRSVCEM